MQYKFDTESRTLTIETSTEKHTCSIESRESLEVLNRLWTSLGWQARYTYQFTWLGRPIIQLPEDTLLYQEILWQLRPDFIIETGVAHGGSLILSASICQLASHGHVIGVDIHIRPQNRAAIESHVLSHRITLIEGDSTSPSTVERVRSCITSGATVLVLLDSGHTKSHVLGELEAYAPLVSPGSYIIAADGIMRDLASLHGASPAWAWDNPAAAVAEFLAVHPDFQLQPPSPIFNESRGVAVPTYWVDGFLKRIC